MATREEAMVDHLVVAGVSMTTVDRVAVVVAEAHTPTMLDIVRTETQRNVTHTSLVAGSKIPGDMHRSCSSTTRRYES